MIRIAHLSDIHFGGENVAAVAGAAQVLRGGEFDLTIVSGDLTQFGAVSEFEAAAGWLASLPGPQLVCPGNHDAPYLAWWERFFDPFGRFSRIIGAAEAQTFAGAGLAVYGLNTARGVQPRVNWSKGQVSRAQSRAALAWLAAAHRSAFACSESTDLPVSKLTLVVALTLYWSMSPTRPRSASVAAVCSAKRW